MKQYKEYKPSGIDWIGEIPSHWFIIKSKNGFYRKKNKAQIESPTILSLTSKGIKVRDISGNDGQIAESYFEYYLVNKGDLLLNPMDLVTNAFSHVSEYEGVISPAYFNLQSLKGFNSNYYKYYYQLQYWNSSFFAHGKGVSIEHRWTLNEATFKNFPIPFPPLPEQTAIGNYLDERTSQVDKLIVNKKKLIKLLKEERAAIINKIIVKGINQKIKIKQSGFEWLGQIPIHWTIKKLRYLGKFQNGVSQGKEYFGSGFPFLSYGDVYKNENLPSILSGLAQSTDDDRTNYSVLEGDVFFTRTSETIEEIGIASTCLSTIPNATFSGFLIRFRPLEGILHPKFSKYFFRSELHRKYFVKEMNLVTRASLSQDLLKNLPVLIPPFAEQKQIAGYIEKEAKRIDNTVSKIEREIELMQEYRTALISEVITGKIKVI